MLKLYITGVRLVQLLLQLLQLYGERALYIVHIHVHTSVPLRSSRMRT